MNALQHLAWLDDKRAAAPVGTLRRALYDREGIEETEAQIARGRTAWVVQRTSSHFPTETRIVFGTSPSDAKRRASAPARLGEGCHGDVDQAARIESGWDEPIVWPLAAPTKEPSS